MLEVVGAVRPDPGVPVVVDVVVDCVEIDDAGLAAGPVVEFGDEAGFAVPEVAESEFDEFADVVLVSSASATPCPVTIAVPTPASGHPTASGGR